VKYLLDTDHISILQWRTSAACTMLLARMAAHPRTDLAFSIISLHEQTRGCHAYLQRARTPRGLVHGYSLLTQVLHDFTIAPVLPFDDAAATVFAGLVAQRLRVRTMDLRIAAIALARGLVVLTRNASDFGQVPGLQIDDWTM
jgi:tRNA(fMet)-specific endonuclease VapC